MLHLIEPFQPKSKGNTYILICMCLLMNYPIAIPISNKTSKTVAQAYLQYVYATFGGSLTLMTDSGKELEK